MKKHAKETFFNTLEYTLSDLNKNNPKQYWKIVKMLMKENSSRCETIPPLVNNDQTYLISEEDKANTLNNYFVSISTVNDTMTDLPVFTSKNKRNLR